MVRGVYRVLIPYWYSVGHIPACMENIVRNNKNKDGKLKPQKNIIYCFFPLFCSLHFSSLLFLRFFHILLLINPPTASPSLLSLLLISLVDSLWKLISAGCTQMSDLTTYKGTTEQDLILLTLHKTLSHCMVPKQRISSFLSFPSFCLHFYHKINQLCLFISDLFIFVSPHELDPI